MNVFIQSNGHISGTFIKNAETGEKIEWITGAKWEIVEGNPVVTLELIFVPGRMIGTAKVYCDSLTEEIAAFVQERAGNANIADAIREKFLGSEINL